MRILLINNFFRDVGGVERVFFIERELLQQHGHEVIDFSTQHPDNHPSAYSKYFVSSVDYQSGGNFFKKVGRLVHSFEVAEKLSKLIEDTKPEVVHIHGIFDLLGPTVVHTLHKHKIPMVFTAHAYKLVCPSGRLFSCGAIDENCQRNLWNDVLHCSVQNSFVKSLGGAIALWVNQLRGTFDLFDRIISPSLFLIHKHVEFGWNQKQFIHIPNPIDVTKFPICDSVGAYMVCVARLVEEKGIDVLLRAAQKTPEIAIKIIGDGPLQEQLQKFVIENNIGNISFEGKRKPEEVREYVRHARAVIVPSVCYENDPYAVLEAQACGAVVIASYTGGIPEQIRQGETGFLVERGNVDALAATMRKVWDMKPGERGAVGKRARGFVDTIRLPELYYEGIADVLGGVKK